ncbi:glycosyltransferase family 2 protein [Paenibacillaceae bacterium WGS1546]|uniref:glycosyltransferase family 2 protein n=1 Tax=Cohnella sp. WGS1546 TaxID=3366810 RepID=UPI00372D3ED6
MMVSVIVATKDRAEELIRFLESLRNQTRQPDELIVVDGSEGPEDERVRARLRSLSAAVAYVRSDRIGSSVQRNIGLDRLHPSADLVCFFDDDVVLERNYLRVIEEAFRRDETDRIGGMNGFPLADGPRRNAPNREYELFEVPDLYGCNMSFRARLVRSLRFDEKLALYGWMEDWDFSMLVARTHKLVCCNQAYYDHLQSPNARVNGRKFGYMQIANRNYLYKKHRLFNKAEYAYYASVLLKNLVRSHRRAYRERCLGNLEALREMILKESGR